MGAKLFSGTTQYQKFLLSPKINLFGLHKIAWCSWQPIGHCNWVICKQTQESSLVCRTFFMDFFSLPLIQEKQAVSYWRNKMVAKQQRKTWVRESCIEQFTLLHNVKTHNMILKKVCVPTKWFLSKQQLILDYRSWYQIKAQTKFFILCADVQIFAFAYSWVLIKIEIKENS